MDILELPDVLLERVLYICDIQTIATTAFVCKSLQRVAASESLWLRICQREFDATDPRRWHSPHRVEQMHFKHSLTTYRLLKSPENH